jgi:hypothetical protein
MNGGAGSPQGLLTGAPTDPDVHVKCIRFVALWSLSLTRLGRFTGECRHPESAGSMIGIANTQTVSAP